MALQQQKMNRDKDSKRMIAIFLSIAVIFVIAFIAVIYYFGFLGAFSILDVTYESSKHLAVFVGIYLLLSIIGELFVKGFYYFLTNKREPHTLYDCLVSFSMNFVMNWVVISIVNGLYEPVQLNWYTEIVMAAFISLIEVTLEYKPAKTKKKRNHGSKP
ncbi:YrvL family regulatory protein [Terribacillus saccharophilus]|uniref:YrvL family regulatory protein n=1 Tax=Terribacillus saccharophilus TaxID=361277 RepID=UPI0039822B86